MSTRDENVPAEENVSDEEYARVSQDYWRVVRESEGFDLEDVSIPSYMCGTPICVMRTFQGDGRYSDRELVKNYCMAGLHRYNMKEGTNYQLSSLIKFNVTLNCVCSYYLTLLAYDPDSSPPKTFQIRIDEKSFGRLDFTCSVARLKEAKGESDSAKEPFIPHYHGGPEASVPFVGELPHWPSVSDLRDQSRFYMVTQSDLNANEWIFMYLVLVIYSHDRLIVTRVSDFVKKLDLVNVALETRAGDFDLEQSKERLKAKSAHVYITFKGLAEPRAPRQSFEVGEHVERRAIVRRVICERTGAMSLLGKLCGGKMKTSVRRQSGEEAAQSSKKARTRRRS